MPKRRGPGEGSIDQHNGRWRARITLESGRRREHTGHTRREVSDWLKAVLEQQRRGILPEPDRQTLAQFLAVWLADTVKPTARPNTYRIYEYLVRVHIAPDHIGGLRLAKLTPQHIQRWVNALAGKELSPQTVKSTYCTLHTALELAVEWNILARNPVALVRPPRVPQREMKTLAPEQVTTLLKAAGDDRLYAVYAVAVALGMREGEILALRWQDVDLDAGVLTVAHTLTRVDGKLTLTEPKTKAGARQITLPPFLVSVLRQHRVRQIEERLRAGERWQDAGYVFTNPYGRPISGPSLLNLFKHLLAKTGLPDMRFHDLRHTAASLYLAQGVPPRMMMETLGHSNISTTLSIYAKILPSLRQEMTDAMERILKG